MTHNLENLKSYQGSEIKIDIYPLCNKPLQFKEERRNYLGLPLALAVQV